MPSAGYVTPNGREIARRREEKEWSREKLADSAKVHKRTIDRLELSKQTRPATIHLVKKALGCDYYDLILDGPPPAQLPLDKVPAGPGIRRPL